MTGKQRDRARLGALAAMRSLLRTQPYDAISMDLVAKEAQLSRRTLYNLFIDRDALFRASREDLLASLSRWTEPVLPAGSDLRDALCACTRHAFDLLGAEDHIDLLTSVIRDGHAAPWLPDRYHRHVRKPLLQGLELALHRVRPAGLPEGLDIARAAADLLSMIEGAVVVPRLFQAQRAQPDLSVATSEKTPDAAVLVERFLAGLR